MRITNEVLNSQLETLKNLTGLNLELDYAYGGVSLVEIEPERHSIIRILSDGRVSKRELSRQMTAIGNMMHAIKNK